MGTVKYTGPVASFHCPTNAEIRSLKVHFSPKQEGTGDPSPENIRTINGTNGLITYKTGKNLFNVDRIEGSPNPTNLSNSTSPRIMDCAHYFVGLQSENYYYKNYTIATVSNGTITVTNKNNNSYGVGFPVCVKSNTTYTLSFTAQNSIVSFGYYDNEWNYLSTSTGSTGENPRTITTPEKTCYMVIVFRAPQYETATYTYSNIQLELGSTATPYEPYRGETTNYTFGVLGKNKLDKSNYKYLNSSIICFGGDTSAEPDGSLFLKAGTYTFSVNATGTIFATDANKRNIAFATDTNTITFTLQESIAVRIVCSFQGATDEEMLAYNYQLELGSTSTAYEPYNPNHTVYGGWVDLITGEVEEEYGMVETTWGAMEGADIRGNYERRQLNVSSIGFIGASVGNLNNRPNRRFCNIAPWRWAYYDDQLHYYADMGIAYVFLPINSDDNITIRIVCYLATPNTYHLAPTQLQTFLGQNNVWSNADYVEVEYDLHETQDILARKQFIMANQPHIVTPAAAPLQNFATDVPAPLKECKVEFKPIQDLHGYDKPWVGGSGKNLFNINAVEQDPDNTTLSNSSARKFTTGTYAKGASYSNYWQASQIIECTINNNAITVSATTGYGVGFPIKMKEGTTYFISCARTGNSSGQINIAPYDAEGNYLGDAVLVNYINQTYTAPANINIGVIIFRNQTSKDNPISTTFSNIQVEVGTAATSYEPYENICPISGWSELTMKRAGKNLFDSWATGYYSPSAGRWMAESQNTNCRPLRMRAGTVVTLSQINTGRDFSFEEWKNCPSSTSDCVPANLFTRASNVTGATQTYTVQNDCWLTARVNIGVDTTTETFANAQIQLELGSTFTSYEPYSGTTIPITFPATKNLFDETYENISGNVTYKSLYVGNNAVTASSDMPLATNSYSNLFILPGQVTSGASTGGNNFNLGKTRTVTPIDGYVTIGYRNNYDIDPRNYHVQIERGSIATAYEPYGTIYGGYVDLVRGKVVAEWGCQKMLSSWSGWSSFNLGGSKWQHWVDHTLPNIENRTVYCNLFKPILIADRYNNSNNFSVYRASSGFCFRYDAIDNIDDWKDYIDEHDVYVAYALQTPIHYPLTPTILKALRGTNNVWSNSNGDITIQFWSH